MSSEEKINEEVIIKLKSIQDSELPINIYDLGLIYKIDVFPKDNKFDVNIEMTVINSRCASTKSFTDLIVNKIESIEEVNKASVKFVFSPKWEVTMISQEGLTQLRNANPY